MVAAEVDGRAQFFSRWDRRMVAKDMPCAELRRAHLDPMVNGGCALSIDWSVFGGAPHHLCLFLWAAEDSVDVAITIYGEILLGQPVRCR